MMSQSVSRLPNAAATILAALVIIMALSTSTALTMPYNTDCMKNPFASGCRGISAKRSAPKEAWPSETAIMGAQKTRESLYDLVSGHPANQLRARQLATVIELLIEATNRLVSLNDWSESSISGKLNQVGIGDYLGSTVRLTNGSKATKQREEASE